MNIKSKLVAVLAVLALVACPLAIIMENTVAAEETNTESNEGSMTLNQLIDECGGGNHFWVQPTVSQDKEDPSKSIVTLNNDTPGDKDIDMLILSYTGELDISSIEFAKGFDILATKTVEIADRDVNFTALTINGKLTSSNLGPDVENGKLMSSKGNLTINPTGTTPITDGMITSVNVDMSCTIMGGEFKNVDVEMQGTLSINSTNDDSKKSYPIFMNRGVISISGEYVFSDIAFEDSLELYVTDMTAIITPMTITCFEYNPGLTKLWNARYEGSTDKDFIFYSDTNNIELTGNMESGAFTFVSSAPTNEETNFKFVDLSLKSMTINLIDANVGDLFFGNTSTNIVDYSKESDSVKFLLNEDHVVGKKIKSAFEVPTKVALTYIVGEGQPKTFDKTVNNEGTTGYLITLVGDEGVKKINKNSLFVVEGKPINLSGIIVTPKDNYEFDGWFYKDDSGKYVKLVDGYIPAGDMNIYAITHYVEPEPPTPTGSSSFDALGVILGAFVAVVVLFFIFCIAKQD